MTDQRRVLLRGGTVYSPADPFATAMLVVGSEVAWIGSEGAALAIADGVDEVVELAGRLVTPTFVDAHVHVTQTGLAAASLDLTAVTSSAGLLAAVAAYVRGLPSDSIVLGYGWDDTDWPDQLPTSAQLARAAGDRTVVLSRIDLHSVLSTMPCDLPGSDPSGHHVQEAAAWVHQRGIDSVPEGQQASARRATRALAATNGIGLLQEMGGPQHGGEADFTAVLELARSEPGPLIVGYWAELNGIDRAVELGAVGVGGDLVVDGSFGSHTAALSQPYADAATSGVLYLGAEQIAEHVVAASAADLPSAFHAIGDAAVDTAVAGFRLAAQQVRTALPNRLEHVEAVSAEAQAAIVELGLIASVQPMFDALWGGVDGMYAQRLGEPRALELNPWASMAAVGIPLAFGSDSPVTPMSPWAAVKAAVNHHRTEQRISARAAFSAHTRGGWRAIGAHGQGVLVPGAPAHYAIWESGELLVQAPDDRIQAWSTDPRSGTPGLPDMSADAPLPRCVRTVVSGQVVFSEM